MSLDICLHGVEPDASAICVVCTDHHVCEDMVEIDEEWHCERCARDDAGRVSVAADAARRVA